MCCSRNQWLSGRIDVEPGPMRGREPAAIDDPAREDLDQAVGRRPPVRRAAIGFAAEVVGVVVELDAVLGRAGLADDALVVVVDVVVADVATPRVEVVVHVIDAEPVVDPALTFGIDGLLPERRRHARREHLVDLVPGVVVAQQVRVHDLAHRLLEAAQVDLARLQLPEQRDAGLEIDPEDGLEAFEGRLHRFVERSLRIHAMDDVDRARHGDPLAGADESSAGAPSEAPGPRRGPRPARGRRRSRSSSGPIPVPGRFASRSASVRT